MQKDKIESRYEINPATINRIEKFKKFLGDKNFEQVLQGAEVVNVPLEEEEFEKLMAICLDAEPECGYANIPYGDAEEILSFFCAPFAGRLLRQAKYTMDMISSLFQKLDPEVLTTAMEYFFSRKKKDTTTGVIN